MRMLLPPPCRRRFLQLLELPASGPLQLKYDPEWLAVLRTTHNLMNLQRRPRSLPGFGGLRSGARAEDLRYVQEVLQQRGGGLGCMPACVHCEGQGCQCASCGRYHLDVAWFA